MNLTRRGFISAAAVLPLGQGLPVPYGFDAHPYLRAIVDRVAGSPIREVTIYKGRSVGATTGVLENVIGWYIDTFRDQDPPAPAEWVTRNLPAPDSIARVLGELHRLRGDGHAVITLDAPGGQL